jgi:hypothetical protein
LLAKLPANQQEQALSACFREDWSGSGDRKAKRILLPVRSLQVWIEQNVLLLLMRLSVRPLGIVIPSLIGLKGEQVFHPP